MQSSHAALGQRVVSAPHSRHMAYGTGDVYIPGSMSTCPVPCVWSEKCASDDKTGPSRAARQTPLVTNSYTPIQPSRWMIQSKL